MISRVSNGDRDGKKEAAVRLRASPQEVLTLLSPLIERRRIGASGWMSRKVGYSAAPIRWPNVNVNLVPILIPCSEAEFSNRG